MSEEPQSTGRWSGVLDRLRRTEAPALIVTLAVVVALVSFAFAASRVDSYRDLQGDAKRDAQADSVQAATASAKALEERLVAIAGSVDRLTARLSAGELDDGLTERLAALSEQSQVRFDADTCRTPDAGVIEFERALCDAATGITELNGIGVVFGRAFDPATAYRPYANRIDGGLDLGALVQREFESTDWYVGAVEAGSGVWTHPRFGRTSQKLIAFYSAPFYAADGSLRGVVLATYALDRLAADLRLLDVGDTGYSVVLSDEGRLVGHPAIARVVADFDAPPGSPGAGSVGALRKALADPPDARPLITDVRDDLTKEDAWIAYAPIPSVEWTIGVVLIEAELVSRTAQQNRLLIDAGLGALAGLFLLTIGLTRAHRGGRVALWVLSGTAAILAVIGIGLVWYVTITGPGDATTDRREVAPEVAAAAAQSAGSEPLFAGVFVQSVEFTGSNDVTVSGLLWQEQRSDDGSSEPPGFVLPEADSATFTEQYRRTSGNVTRVGWSFTASLRQTFDYSRYPLDRETVWLRLWPADYETSWLMLPELTSYETLAPSTRPGIEDDFVVEGWVLEGSTFSFVNNDYNTDFGLRELAEDDTPELYFDIILKRSFLDALMSQLVPLSVVAVLLFAVLLITKPEPDSALGVLGYCAALFFVVIVSHTQLRSSLQAEQVIYLEYFYFVAYAAILGVSANAILVGNERSPKLLRDHDNLVPKLLFWPSLNILLLVVTLAAFY